jgi:hypothetical protein
MSSDANSNELADLVASILRGGRPMTPHEIAAALTRRSGVRVDARGVTLVLIENRRRFRLNKSRFFQRRATWQLVEAGPADDPGHAGAPVPAWPHRPTLSGAAALPLAFREDDPPTNAVGDAV